MTILLRCHFQSWMEKVFNTWREHLMLSLPFLISVFSFASKTRLSMWVGILQNSKKLSVTLTLKFSDLEIWKWSKSSSSSVWTGITTQTNWNLNWLSFLILNTELKHHSASSTGWAFCNKHLPFLMFYCSSYFFVLKYLNQFSFFLFIYLQILDYVHEGGQVKDKKKLLWLFSIRM